MAIFNNRAKGLTGLNPLAYMGVEGAEGGNTVVPLVCYPDDPSPTDFQNFNLMTLWLNTTNKNLWYLASLAGNQALWLILSAGSGDVLELTSNSGGPVFPLVGNINVVGDGIGITGVGNPGTHTITFSLIGGGQAIQGLQPQLLGVNVGLPVTPTAGIIDVNNTDGNILFTNGGGNLFNTRFADSIRVNNDYAGLNGTISVFNDGTTANPVALIQAIQEGATGANASGVMQIIRQHGSTLIPTPILTGDRVGSFSYFGYDGTNYVESAGIRSTSSGTIAANRVAGNLAFHTHPDSTSGLLVATQRMLISSAGNVTINAPDSGNALDLPNSSATVQAMISTAGTRFVSDFGTANTFIGSGSGNFTLTVGSAISNSSVGQLTLQSLTTGNNNSAFGWANLIVCTTGDSNTAVGSNVLTSLTSGSANTAIGNAALSNIAGGLVTGSSNIAIGSGAGTNYRGAESSNLLMSNDGVLGESNHIRIGTTGAGAKQQNKCWIAAIRGVTTDVNDAIAVLIDSTGQLGTISSSARYKENIEDMNDQSEVIYDLRPRTFNFKKYPDSPAWGLIAEEVDEAFPRLVVYDDQDRPETVRYHDLVPLMLNEIQKLNKRLIDLEKIIQNS